MTTLTGRFRDGSFKGRRRPAGRLSVTAAGIVAKLLAWYERARQRRALLSLSDRQLSDIGISRAEADGEGDKPFWRA